MEEHDPGGSSGEEKRCGDVVWMTGQMAGFEESHTRRQEVRGSNGEAADVVYITTVVTGHVQLRLIRTGKHPVLPQRA